MQTRFNSVGATHARNVALWLEAFRCWRGKICICLKWIIPTEKATGDDLTEDYTN